MTQAYPLQWPMGVPRTESPARSKFHATHDQAVRELLHEIKLLGGRSPVISTNVPRRKDGMPYASYMLDDHGVAVYFDHDGRKMCFACDKWDLLKDNIYAVAKTIDALRGIRRWGSGKMIEQAFTGFVALPAPPSPWETLGLAPGSSREAIERAFREKARVTHPDAGGNSDAMARLNEARARALEGAA